MTRDVLPRKAQITLTTSPAGLQLRLDGQPVATPHSVTGVVGIERDLAAADQTLNGRRYQFASWSDGMAASHTIATPAAATTYTATFTDLGPVTNQVPSVSVSAPSSANVGLAVTLSALAVDPDGTVTRVEFFDGSTLLGSDASSPYTLAWTPATAGARNITARATDNAGAATTSASIVVTVAASGGPDTSAPTTTLTAPANLASGLPRQLLLCRLCQQVHRPGRFGERQRHIGIRQRRGQPGGPARRQRRRAVRADAQRHHADQRTLTPRPARTGEATRDATRAATGEAAAEAPSASARPVNQPCRNLRKA